MEIGAEKNIERRSEFPGGGGRQREDTAGCHAEQEIRGKTLLHFFLRT